MDHIETWVWIIPPAWCWIMAAICVAIVAHSKGREAFGWFCYGLLMWPVALTHILVSEPERDYTRNMGHPPLGGRSRVPHGPQNEHAVGSSRGHTL